MVRIADKQLMGKHLTRLNQARSAHSRSLEQAATGKKVLRPSDDPAAFGHLERLKRRLAALEETGPGRTNARSRFQAAEAALGQANDQIFRLRELAVMASNDAFSAENRAALASEVDVLGEQLGQLAATKFGDAFLFGGTRTDQPPFDENGRYQGGGGGSMVALGAGHKVDLAIEGGAIFDGNQSAGAIVDDLVTALENDDTEAIAATLDRIDELEDQITQGRAEIGVKLTRVDLADAMVDELDFQLQKEERDVSDADLASVLAQLTEQERALEVAIEVTGRSMQRSLLDVL